MNSLRKHQNNPPSPHIPGIFRIGKKSGPMSFTSPTSVQAECWQASRAVVQRLFDTEHNTTSAHLSDRTEFSLNDFSVDEMCSMTHSPLNSSTGIDTNLLTHASRDFCNNDDDSSTESEEDYLAYKRRCETDEDDRKPAAKRQRREETMPALPFDNRESLTHNTDKVGRGAVNRNSKINIFNADQSTATINTARLSGERRGGLCGSCSTCLDQAKCRKCESCRKNRDGRCAFRPCLQKAYRPATLQTFLREATIAKSRDKSLENKFEALYGKNGAMAAKLMAVDHIVPASCKPPKNGQRRGRRCGSCSSCSDPITCLACITCRGLKKGKCVFALCLVYNYSTRTLIKFRTEADAIKIGNKRLEDKFEELYGGNSVFASKFNDEESALEVKHAKTLKCRCETCSSFTSGKCQSRHRKRNERCAFYTCLLHKYDTATIQIMMKEAMAVNTDDKRLKDQSAAIYGERGLIAARYEKLKKAPRPYTGHNSAGSARRYGRYSCKCSSCSSLPCRVCHRCRDSRRCVFRICQGYNYDVATLKKYKRWAQTALEICNDQTLNLNSRFEQLYGTNGDRRDGECSKKKVATQKQSSIKNELCDKEKHAGVPETGFEVPACKESKEVEEGDDRAPVDNDTSRNSLKKKTKAVGFSSHDYRIAAANRTPNNENHGHFLLNKGFYHEWINREGKRKVAYGTFYSCNKIEGVLQFCIALDLSVGKWLAFGVRNEAPNPPLFCVEEADAWAGYIAYVAQSEGKQFVGPSVCLPKKKPFYRHYILPTTIHACSQERTVELVLKGYRLQLKAKESRIPNGGLGLFVKAKPIASLDLQRKDNNAVFVLDEGELVDLGVYGPLQTEDMKPDHVVIVKDFVHNMKTEKWSFEAFGDSRLVFDITDDETGDLSKVAANNILVFSNETNGKETPTLFAKTDPEGAMHYYLGHSDCGQGRLLIPADGSEIELKVDYGPNYELVRVRNGYSRLSGWQLQQAMIEACSYEKDMLDDLSKLTTGEIFDIYNFLEKLNSSWTDAKTINDKGPVGRAMLVALLLLRRVTAINNREYGAGAHTWLVHSLHRLSRDFFDRFDYGANRSLILNERYAGFFSSALGFSVIKSSWDNTYSIRNAIENLAK